jgi:hypothetical protein
MGRTTLARSHVLGDQLVVGLVRIGRLENLGDGHLFIPAEGGDGGANVVSRDVVHPGQLTIGSPTTVTEEGAECVAKGHFSFLSVVCHL